MHPKGEISKFKKTKNHDKKKAQNNKPNTHTKTRHIDYYNVKNRFFIVFWQCSSKFYFMCLFFLLLFNLLLKSKTLKTMFIVLSVSDISVVIIRWG